MPFSIIRLRLLMKDMNGHMRTRAVTFALVNAILCPRLMITTHISTFYTLQNKMEAADNASNEGWGITQPYLWREGLSRCQAPPLRAHVLPLLRAPAPLRPPASLAGGQWHGQCQQLLLPSLSLPPVPSTASLLLVQVTRWRHQRTICQAFI